MGKGKAKKSSPTAIGKEFSKPPDFPHCKCGHDHPKAADGQNVDGWTEEDIKIYNELLAERAKLEKEKEELEQKSARHQAERALLNEDAAAFDRLFKSELGGDYKFTGNTPCCLDFEHSTSPRRVPSKNTCHHEICGRAKAQGISWMEMDTIKYYQARIASEKSQRMKNALRKQRDVELGRIKKEDDEEEHALRNRRAAMYDRIPAYDGTSPDAYGNDKEFSLTDDAIMEAARENGTVVKRIRSRLDKIRNDVNSGRVTAYDARLKLEQANKEMTQAERKNNAFKEMAESQRKHDSLKFKTPARTRQDHLLAATSPTALSHALTKSLAGPDSDTFSEALNVLEGFFSSSDPQDVQAAISNLRTALEANGPMSPALRKSLQDLESILARPNAKGFDINLATNDGMKQVARNVIELLLSFRNPENKLRLKSAAKEHKIDKMTLRANKDCMRIEEEASNLIDNVHIPPDPAGCKQAFDRFKEIKEGALKKSPIPELSVLVLETKIEDILYPKTMLALLNQCKSGATEQELMGTVTSIVIQYSDKNRDRFMSTLARLQREADFEDVDAEASLKVVRKALTAVGEKMVLSVAKHQEKEASQESTKPEQDQSPKKDDLGTSYLQNFIPRDRRPARLKSQRLNLEAYADGVADNSDSFKELGPVFKLLPKHVHKIHASLITPEFILSMIPKDIADKPGSSVNRLAIQHFREKYAGNDNDAHDIEIFRRIFSDFAALSSQREALHEAEAKSKARARAREMERAREEISRLEENLVMGNTFLPPSSSARRSGSGNMTMGNVPVNTPVIQDNSAVASEERNEINEISEAMAAANLSAPEATTTGVDLVAEHSHPPSEAASLLSDREETLRRQLQAMHENLQTMRTKEALPVAVDFGIPVAFDSIQCQLETQLQQHVDAALMFCDASDWVGLRAWIRWEFGH